jgi:CRP-like cAMP-binding protein
MHFHARPSACGLKVQPCHNRLLGALHSTDLTRWTPHLELVSLAAGASLQRQGDYPHVYFPATASVSLLRITREGASVEIIGIGNEGMVGLPVIMGGGSAPGDAVVRVQGHAYRMSSVWLRNEFHANPTVMNLLLRYTQALMTHSAQSALCNRLHSLEKRLCRCFLGHLDHVNGAPLSLTHDSLSGMLGVRREGVTCAAQKLQRAGLIDYARGRVEVIDRQGLEACSCKCYQLVRDEYERLLCPQPAFDGGPVSRPLGPGDGPAPSAPVPPAIPRTRYSERTAMAG